MAEEAERYCSDCAWPYECAEARSCHRRDMGEVRGEDLARSSDCSPLSSEARCARPDAAAPARGLVLEFPARVRPLRLSAGDQEFLPQAALTDAEIGAFLAIDLATGPFEARFPDMSRRRGTRKK